MRCGLDALEMDGRASERRWLASSVEHKLQEASIEKIPAGKKARGVNKKSVRTR